MNAPTDSFAVSLRDGRRLTYRCAGPPDGMLVLYLHGAIGSPQTVCPELEAVVAELGVRYVMVSRPGFGGSDPLAGRTMLRFADDVTQLVDALGRERFAVVGVSTGGPYALACAHELSERVAATAVVSCMAGAGGGPRNLQLAVSLPLRVLRRRPRTCTHAGDALLGLVGRHPRVVARVMRAAAASADGYLPARSEARELAAARFLAAARRGVGGMIDDYLLCAAPWGFDPAGVPGLVQLWHGMRDTLVPVDEAIQLAAGLPHVQIELDPDEGHFFYRRRLREILGDLAAASRRRAPQAQLRHSRDPRLA
ncbi:MAG: hypothetical protein QOD83_3278 [Solirubrobacteraceae bacterium]|jgi:pimeloyl-ACP methyl ester carboxylesterase|nr:hypothetical protein [Solirubrobacteraceae bacterium]